MRCVVGSRGGVGGVLVTTKVTTIVATYNATKRGTTASTKGPFLTRCSAPFNIPPFSLVGMRRCGRTFLGKVRRRGGRVSTVIGRHSIPSFSGAVTTFSRDKRLLGGIDAIFDNLGDYGAGSRVRTFGGRVAPLLSTRQSSVGLGPTLFTHIGRICRHQRGLKLSGRRGGLLRRACGGFIHKNTGLSSISRTGLHRLGDRVSVLRLAFKRGLLGRAGTFRLIVSGGRSLTKLPRDLITSTTRTTGKTNVRRG